MTGGHSKSRISLHGQNISLEKKKWKNIIKNHLLCVKNEEKTAKEVKMHEFLVCLCKSEDFAESQKKFARLHDLETVTFRNSGDRLHVKHGM